MTLWRTLAAVRRDARSGHSSLKVISVTVTSEYSHNLFDILVCFNFYASSPDLTGLETTRESDTLLSRNLLTLKGNCQMTCGLQITHTATHGRHPTSPNPPCARDPEGNRGSNVAVLYLARTFTSGRRRTSARMRRQSATQRQAIASRLSFGAIHPHPGG